MGITCGSNFCDVDMRSPVTLIAHAAITTPQTMKLGEARSFSPCLGEFYKR